MSTIKIGNLTFQRTTNYGAQLQNYALQEYLKQFNNLEVDVINYENEKINGVERRIGLLEEKSIKNIIKYFLVGRKRNNRWDKFEEFRSQYMNLTERYNKYNIEQIENKYDYFLVGSDQVWNTDITGNDYNYMLDFVKDNKKKCSYAASIGKENIDNKKLLTKISEFQQINVREDSAKKLLEENGIKNVKTVTDPVFFLSKDEWIKKLNLVPKKGNYILVYIIDNYKENIKRIREYAKQKHLDVVYINNNILNSHKVKDIKTASPKDFLEYLYGAKYVITGSFHAICFSLIFNKDFYYILNKTNKRNSRMTDLMNKLDIKNKDVTDKKEIKETNINYELINLKIENEIKKSKDILKKMINEWEGSNG